MPSWLASKRQDIASAGENVEKRENFGVDGDANGAATMENSK